MERRGFQSSSNSSIPQHGSTDSAPVCNANIHAQGEARAPCFFHQVRHNYNKKGD